MKSKKLWKNFQNLTKKKKIFFFIDKKRKKNLKVYLLTKNPL